MLSVGLHKNRDVYLKIEYFVYIYIYLSHILKNYFKILKFEIVKFL